MNIYFLCSSGVVELMYSRNGNWSLLPWPSNNPKGVRLFWLLSKMFSLSKYLSASVRILELIDFLGDMQIKPGINLPLNLQTVNPRDAFPYPIFSSVVLLESYGIYVRQSNPLISVTLKLLASKMHIHNTGSLVAASM